MVAIIVYSLLGVLLFFNILFLWSKSAEITSKRYVDKEGLKQRLFYRNWLFVTLFFTLTLLYNVTAFLVLALYGSIPQFLSIVFILLFYYLVLKWPEILKDYAGPVYEEEDIEKLENFGLYLRSFKDDTDKNIHSIEKAFCKKFQYIAPFFAVGNPREFLPSIGAEKLYLSDDRWQEIVGKLLGRAQFIMIKPNGSNGCRWELDNCCKTDYFTKTLFVIDNDESLSILNEFLEKSSYPMIDIEHITTTKIVFLSEDGEECYCYDYKKSKVESVVNSFLNTHSRLSAFYDDFLERRKHLVHHLVHDKMPAEANCGRLGMLTLFAYLNLNYWKRSTTFVFYCATLLGCFIFGMGYALWGLPVYLDILLFLLIIAPFIYLAPKISWFSYNWSCPSFFRKNAGYITKFACFSILTVLFLRLINYLCK